MLQISMMVSSNRHLNPVTFVHRKHLQHCCLLILNGVTSSIAELNCGSLGSVAGVRRCGKLNFSDISASSSQITVLF